MRRISLALVCSLVFAVLVSGRATAHALGQSYVFLRISEESIRGRFEITLDDLNRELRLELPTDGTATDTQIDPHAGEIEAYLQQSVRFAADGSPVELVLGEHLLFTIPLAQYVQVEFELAGLAGEPTTLDIDYGIGFEGDPDHRGMLVVEHNWKTGTFNNEAMVSLIFSPSSRRQTLDLTSSSTLRGFAALIELGIHHIWVGIDHILFLIALLLPSVVRRDRGRWRMAESFRGALWRVIKIVTLFTIAHSVTLSLAALGVVRIPSRLVESIIAVSIAVAALDILLPIFKNRIWIVVFAFGLFHGFGFASVLSAMGITSGYMALSLLGFNLGVEIGQAAIVLLAFPVLFLLRSTTVYVRYLLPATAALLILVSLYWFTERAFGVDLPAGALARQLMGLFA